jgi:hypothetical protein
VGGRAEELVSLVENQTLVDATIYTSLARQTISSTMILHPCGGVL